jgi:hypothetical protein
MLMTRLSSSLIPFCPHSPSFFAIELSNTGITYRRAQLARSALPWRYDGMFAPVDGHAACASSVVRMQRNHDAARQRSGRLSARSGGTWNHLSHRDHAIPTLISSILPIDIAPREV